MIRSFLCTAGVLVLTAMRAAPLGVSVSILREPFCTSATGIVEAYASNGVPPYSFVWEDSSVDVHREGLVPGTYTITVTDSEGSTASSNVTLTGGLHPEAQGFFRAFCVPGFSPLSYPPYRCFANADEWNVGQWPITFDGGAEVAYFPSDGFQPAVMVVGADFSTYAPGTPLQLTFTDASGCAGTLDLVIPQGPAYPQPQLLSVDGACSGQPNGGFTVHFPLAANRFGYHAYLLHEGTPYYGAATVPEMQYDAGYSDLIGQEARTFVRHDLLPGTYQLVMSARFDAIFSRLEEVYFPDGPICTDTILTFEVPDLGVDCGGVSGKVFQDDGVPCVKDGFDQGLADEVLEVAPIGLYTLTDAAGDYRLNMPHGSYGLVHAPNPLYADHCAAGPLPFDVTAADPSAVVHVPDSSLVPVDVSIAVGSGAARPGMEVVYGLAVRDRTASTTGAITCTFTFDPLLAFVSAQPTPSSVTESTVTWTLPALSYFQSYQPSVRLQVPADVGSIGTTLTASASVTIAAPEPLTANNTASTSTLITGSFDPNDKQVWPRDVYRIGADDELDYTIRFQNTGTDTAFFVVVTDTLPADVDPLTFRMGASSHPCTVDMRGTGILRFMFANILLPDSNVNEPASHGFLTFRIRPRQPLVPGTVIANGADIFFDYNPPVRTADATVVLETPTGIAALHADGLSVHPNPANTVLVIEPAEPVDPGTTVAIYTTDGRLVQRHMMTGTRSVLDVSLLGPGLYVLEVRTAQGRMQRIRWMKA